MDIFFVTIFSSFTLFLYGNFRLCHASKIGRRRDSISHSLSEKSYYFFPPALFLSVLIRPSLMKKWKWLRMWEGERQQRTHTMSAGHKSRKSFFFFSDWILLFHFCTVVVYVEVYLLSLSLSLAVLSSWVGWALLGGKRRFLVLSLSLRKKSFFSFLPRLLSPEK